MADKVKLFSPDEIATFCSQIAMLLNGGIPLYEGTYILYEELEEGRTKDVLAAIDEEVKTGKPFYEALRESGAFPEYMIHMVMVGETTGKLEEVMYSLASYYERECRVKSSIRSVIAYPVMLFGMMAVILFVLVFRILPMFEGVFQEMDGRTASSENMMNMSLLTGKVIAVAVAVLVVLIVAVLIWYRSKAGGNALTAMVNGLPMTRKLAERLGTGKFLAALSVMVSSGTETGEAMERAALVVDNGRTQRKIARCRELIAEGGKFDEAMSTSGILTGLQGRMLSVGLKSGVGDTVLAKLSGQYDEEIDERLNSLSSYVETVLIVLLSVIVGAVLISVMMPLISVISSI